MISANPTQSPPPLSRVSPDRGSPVATPDRGSLATTPVARSYELPSSLEAVINDCFRASVDKASLCSERLAYANSFTKYLQEIHCSENLMFLMEVFRYEYFHEKIHPGLSKQASSVSASSGKACICEENPSFDQLIQSLPFPTGAMKKLVRKASVQSQSNHSLHSMASSANAPFDLDLDDLPKGPSEVWNTLSEQCISDTESEPDSLLSADGDDSTSILATQWHYIMDTFVYEHSPCQVNLCNKTYRALAEADSNHMYSPQALAPAKKEVMRLIYENAYSSFTQKHQDLRHTECPCSPESTTSPHPSKNPGLVLTPDRSCCSTPSSLGSQKSQKSQVCRTHGVVAPVPNKRRSKFLSSLSGSSSSDAVGSPSSTINSFLSHLKPPGHSRSVQSAPQSPFPSSTPTRSMSPTFRVDQEELMSRSRSSAGLDGHNSSSLLEKLWRKKK